MNAIVFKDALLSTAQVVNAHRDVVIYDINDNTI